MTEFLARAAAFVRDEDLEADILVLAEQEDGSGRRLEIQRSVTTTAADVQAGMDTYCLADDTGATHYGGVSGWSLDEDVVCLSLDSEAADALGTSEYLIRLAGGPPAASPVRHGLEAVLAASPSDG